jgi:hypothetical protein
MYFSYMKTRRKLVLSMVAGIFCGVLLSISARFVDQESSKQPAPEIAP